MRAQMCARVCPGTNTKLCVSRAGAQPGRRSVCFQKFSVTDATFLLCSSHQLGVEEDQNELEEPRDVPRVCFCFLCSS